MKKTLIASTAVAAMAVAGATALTVMPANADVERHGVCGGARYELNVDRELRGFDVDAEIDRATPGSAWRVTLRHNGKIVLSQVQRADREGELETQTWRGNTKGADTFRLTVRPVGVQACSTAITMR